MRIKQIGVVWEWNNPPAGFTFIAFQLVRQGEDWWVIWLIFMGMGFALSFNL